MNSLSTADTHEPRIDLINPFFMLVTIALSTWLAQRRGAEVRKFLRSSIVFLFRFPLNPSLNESSPATSRQRGADWLVDG